MISIYSSTHESNMKRILFLFLLCLPHISKAQFGLNMTELGVKEQYVGDHTYSIIESWHNKKEKQVTAFSQTLSFNYIFSQDEHLSYISTIIPKRQSFMDKLIETYNNDYMIIVKGKEWKLDSEIGLISMKLEYLDEYSCFGIVHKLIKNAKGR